jgi:hypothetical protein
MKTRFLFVALAAFTLAACGGKDKDSNSEEHATENPVAPNTPVPSLGGSSSCNQLVQDYDQFLTEYLAAVDQFIDDKITQEQLDAIASRGEGIGQQIEAQGEAGLGAACYQQYAAASLKWSQAAMKLAPKLMEKAAAEMRKQGN